MNSIHYLKGDATSPQAKGKKIIAHICNNIGGWGKGFVLAISKRWLAPEKAYREWHRERAQNDFGLGKVQFIEVDEWITVANMIGQQGIKANAKGVPPIRYEALEQCLEKLAEYAKDRPVSIHLPRIGCGLAGGKWELIEPIIEKTLLVHELAVYVYDF
jgi:O-acetyl-ADP-ribose deacetylase (regulator of RNase III)